LRQKEIGKRRERDKFSDKSAMPNLSPFLSPPCRIFVSLCLSLFSIALTGDGRDWVAAVQSEMGSTGGTKRRRSMMVVKKGAVYIFMRLRFGY
jgi:hypothetical protein